MSFAARLSAGKGTMKCSHDEAAEKRGITSTRFVVAGENCSTVADMPRGTVTISRNEPLLLARGRISHNGYFVERGTSTRYRRVRSPLAEPNVNDGKMSGQAFLMRRKRRLRHKCVLQTPVAARCTYAYANTNHRRAP